MTSLTRGDFPRCASASVGRHSSCRETVPVRLRRHPRRYFPSFDRKHPITPVIPCNIVQHHGQPPRRSMPDLAPEIPAATTEKL
ncbi:hypothetical protein K0M31_006929 [Melipona bicolor]|uniref:Uncharacterized protein n=1 Tax=Melipona bicolor TaxID=60889 RepID=A0AA40FRB3_9HYME|nr:hypothetical protein K0M31_006929 [Melipona bicolor]